MGTALVVILILLVVAGLGVGAVLLTKRSRPAALRTDGPIASRLSGQEPADRSGPAGPVPGA